MANPNLGQDVANEKRNKELLILWPNLILYTKLQECVVTVLLLTSTPLLLTSSSICSWPKKITQVTKELAFFAQISKSLSSELVQCVEVGA